MSLGLQVNRTRGRAQSKLPPVLAVTELTQAQLAEAESIERGIQPNALKRLSFRHKQLAKALVSGMTNIEASAEIGLDHARIAVLKSDPTFKEYLAVAAKENDEAFSNLNHRLAGLATESAVILENRLEETPEDFDNEQLARLLTLGADRTGFGVSSKTEVSVTHNLGEDLERARQRVKEKLQMKTIEGTAEEIKS